MTVFLSFVLISVAILELICMLGFYKSPADMKQSNLVLFYAITESLPTILIAFYLSTSIVSDDSMSDHYQTVG